MMIPRDTFVFSLQVGLGVVLLFSILLACGIKLSPDQYGRIASGIGLLAGLFRTWYNQGYINW